MTTKLRMWNAVAIFPLVVCATLWTGHRLIDQGMTEFWVILGLHVAAGVTIAILERVFPLHDSWKHSQGDIPADAGHSMVSAIMGPELLRPVLLAGGAWIAGWTSAQFGATFWPTQWHWVPALALALVVGEFGQYWIHRWTHEHPLLWRLHATHHSAPRLYWLNAGRFHPLDYLLNFGMWFLPLVALGCPPDTIALVALFTGVHGMFQHANLELRLGPLNWIFSMAELHRWHHSKVLSEANANYGANLIVWDIVFGTRYLPERLPSSAIGIEDMPGFPQGYFAQLLSPFQWKRVVARSAPVEPGSEGLTSP